MSSFSYLQNTEIFKHWYVARGMCFLSDKSEGDPGIAFPEGFSKGPLASSGKRRKWNSEGKAKTFSLIVPFWTTYLLSILLVH